MFDTGGLSACRGLRRPDLVRQLGTWGHPFGWNVVFSAFLFPVEMPSKSHVFGNLNGPHFH